VNIKAGSAARSAHDFVPQTGSERRTWIIRMLFGRGVKKIMFETFTKCHTSMTSPEGSRAKGEREKRGTGAEKKTGTTRTFK